MELTLFQPRSHENYLRRRLGFDINGNYTIVYELGNHWTRGFRPIDAAIEAARLIRLESENEQIVIPLSGGIDSECVARSFLAAGIEFVPVIMRFDSGFNEFDIRWAFEFCDNHGLSPRVLDLNLEDFYASNAHLVYAKRYKCRSPQIATHLWMAEQVAGHFVFPYNPLVLQKHQLGGLYLVAPSELQLSYDRFFTANQRSGTGLFFLYTPETIYSFLQLPRFLDLLLRYESSHQRLSGDSYLMKVELYRSGGFDVCARPNKATGFEVFRSYLNSKYWQRGQHGDWYDSKFRRPMELIVNDRLLLSIAHFDLEGLYDLDIASCAGASLTQGQFEAKSVS